MTQLNTIPTPPYPDDHGQDLTNWFVDHGKTLSDWSDLLTRAYTWPRKEYAKDPAALDQNARRYFGGKTGAQFKPRLVADEILTDRQLMYDPVTSQLYAWNCRHWEEYHEAHIRSRALRMLGVEGTSPRVSDVCRIVQDLSLMDSGRQFNDRHDLLPVKNGCFSLSDGKVRGHDPGHLNNYTLDITLNLSGTLPDCPTWKQFITQFVPDLPTLEEVQKFAGYCLTRETRHEKALFLVGPGGDGKSTFIRVLESILGEVNVSNVSLGALEDQFQRVMIKDKLLNVATEIESGHLQSNIFKALVSGDRITAAYKHKDAFSFKPVAKHIFAANKLPSVADTSKGFYRKIMLIEVEKSYEKPDLFLYDKLLQERDGIFFWMVRGLQRLIDEGFRDTEYMADCLERYQEANNPVIGFVNVNIESTPETVVEVLQVYKRYVSFCKARGYLPKSEVHFARELRIVLPTIRRVQRGSRGSRQWCYEGIELIYRQGEEV